MSRTIQFDHELTPAALRLVADLEKREAREARDAAKARRLAAAKAERLAALKEAGRRVAERKVENSQK